MTTGAPPLGPAFQVRRPRPLRRVVGELRSVAPGLFLGRMDIAVGARRRTVMFFTLEG